MLFSRSFNFKTDMKLNFNYSVQQKAPVDRVWVFNLSYIENDKCNFEERTHRHKNYFFPARDILSRLF